MTTSEFKKLINKGDNFIDLTTKKCSVINAVKIGTNSCYLGIVASGEKVTCCLNIGSEYYLKISYLGADTSIEVLHPVGGVISSNVIVAD